MDLGPTVLLKSNDIVFSTVGSRPPAYDSMVGKAILVKNKFEGCLLNQNAVLIRTRSNKKCFQRFLYYHFKTSRYLDYIETIIRGNANQVSITLEDLFKYKITLPTSEIEQQKIVKVISCWDDAIEKTEKLISAKTQFKKALMQKLLTGKIRFGEFVKSTESLNGKYYPYPKDWKYLEIRPKGLFHNCAVEILVYEETPLGFKAIVNDRYNGLIYRNEVFESLHVGDKRTAYVKNIRTDGNLDISLTKLGSERKKDAAQNVLSLIKENGGSMPYNYKSDAELITKAFGLSKKAFKASLTELADKNLIEIKETGIYLK